MHDGLRPVWWTSGRLKNAIIIKELKLLKTMGINWWPLGLLHDQKTEA